MSTLADTPLATAYRHVHDDPVPIAPEVLEFFQTKQVEQTLE
mgnify:CR=1 FL=1